MSKVIENWFVARMPEDPYTPPEAQYYVLIGLVDGTMVQTSEINNSFGNIVNTQNSTYKLGTPDPKWIQFLDEKGIIFDKDNPIKIKVIS